VVRIFLSYAREDEMQVRGVYRRLIDAGFEVWMDKINLLPGQRWQQEIPRAIRNSDFILIFFSKNSVAKRGYVQREFRLALDTLEEMPPDAIHTIPIRLDDCQIPEQFHHLQWSDLSEEGEFDRIVRALRLGMEQRQTGAPEPALEPPPEPIVPAPKSRQVSVVTRVGLVIAAVSALAAVMMVPEVRQWLGVAKPPAQRETSAAVSPSQEITTRIGMKFVRIPAGEFQMGSERVTMMNALCIACASVSHFI
jgi:TIR domain